jgi:hypothetical protein
MLFGKKKQENEKSKKRVKADVGNYVKAETKSGEVTGVVVPFRGREVIQTREGIEDIKRVTDIPPAQDLGDETQHFVKSVRRRYGVW